jgi:DNA-binding NarL/FixJ family response regulator
MRPEGRHRLVIADDHAIMREGLRALLETEDSFEVVGTAENGREAVSAVREHQPDLLLMDLSMPQADGLSAIRELVRRGVRTKVLVLTMHRTEEHIRAALQAGAGGYVLKDATRSELLTAIRTVLKGKTYVSPAVAERIVSGYLDGRRGEPGAVRSLADRLTTREKQVLKLIAEGARNRDIAEALFLSVKTVEKHRANLMAKLDLHNTAALTAFAIENKLIGP